MVPIIRTVIFLGLYWGPLILGKYHVDWRVLLGWVPMLVEGLGFRVGGAAIIIEG